MGIENNTRRFDLGIRNTSAKASSRPESLSDPVSIATILGKSELKLEKQDTASCLPMLSTLKRAFNEMANAFRKIDQKILSANTGTEIPAFSLKELAIMCNPERHTPLSDAGISRIHQSLMPTPDNKVSPRMQALITHAIKDIEAGGRNLAKLQDRAPDMYALLMSEALTRGPQSTSATALLSTAATYDMSHNRGNTLKGLLHPNHTDRFQKLTHLLGESLTTMASTLPNISGDLLLALTAQPVIDALRDPECDIPTSLRQIKQETPRTYTAVMREILFRGIPLDTNAPHDTDRTLLQHALMEDRDNGSPILIEMGQNTATKTRFSDLIFNYIESPAEAMSLFRSAQPDAAAELATRYAHNRATVSNDHINQIITLDFVKLSEIVDHLIHAGLDIDSAKETIKQAARASTEALETEIETRIPESERTGDIQDYETVSTAIFNETASTESQRLMAMANDFKTIASATGGEVALLGQIKNLDPAYLPALEAAAKSMNIEIPYRDGNIDLEKVAARKAALEPLVLTDLQQYAALKTLTIDTLSMIDSLPNEPRSKAKLAAYFTAQLPADGAEARIGRMLAEACLSALTEIPL